MESLREIFCGNLLETVLEEFGGRFLREAFTGLLCDRPFVKLLQRSFCRRCLREFYGRFFERVLRETFAGDCCERLLKKSFAGRFLASDFCGILLWESLVEDFCGRPLR